MSMTTEVLIVGAGPSGSFLGYLLARSGVEVRIIDKAAFPRAKVCGGGLSYKSIQVLPFDISPVIQRRIRGAYLTFGNRDTVVTDLDDRSGAVVLRSEFDAFLLQKAIAAGVRFDGRTAFLGLEPHPAGVMAMTTRGGIAARYLAGADGVFSQVREKVFGRGLVTYAPALEALVSVSSAARARLGDRVLFDFGSMPKGYGWIFPKRDHLNVGVFSIYPSGSIRTELARFMSRYRVLDAPAYVRCMGLAIPLKNTRREYERGCVLLVGDAAGFAESLYGEGIYFALESARIAAEALARGFDRPGARMYSRLIARRLEPELRYAAMNARLFYPHQRIGFYHLARNRYVSRYFAEVVAGGVGYRECFFKTLLTLPYWMFLPRMASEPDARF